MTQTEPYPLKQLAATFRAEDLGEGDPNLGINLISTMAAVLADLAPADGTILAKDGRPARLGTNLLVTGPASAGLVVDEVLTEVGRRQTNLWHYLRRYAEHIERQRQKQGASLPPMNPKSGAPEDRIAETQHELEPLLNTRVQSWGRIFSETPEEDIAALVSRPKFLVSLRSPNDLPDQLCGLRPGPTLVHAGFTRPKDLAALAESGSALIQGHYSLGNGCEAARGHFLITDPLKTLQMVAKEPDEGTEWLGHFLWLCDGDAGPEVPAEEKAPNETGSITKRFRMALDAVLATRMNLPNKRAFQIALNTREAKIRFRSFLTEMEPRLPGISMAARNLIDSLAFGLGQMAAAGEQLRLSVGGVEALARFLVHRMANARTMMLHSGAVARRRSQIERVYWKLQQGPTNARQIYRALSKLPAGDCDECLRWMEGAGVARCVDNRWELAEGARLHFEAHTLPLLEI